MSLLKNLFVLLFMLGFYASANAAVGDISTSSCSVFSEADEGAKGEGGEEEEEPDCE